MASYGEGGYEGQKHHGSDDAYGNPVGQTDEYGNPTQHTTGGTEYGTTGAPAHGVGLSTGTGAHQLQRTSSSSSEDDGEGGRRKKSIKEKIKDKFPHKEEQQIHTTTPVSGESYGTSGEYGAPGTLEQPHEKKGLMEKIKDKLPGGHKEEQQTHTTTSPAVTGRSYGATDGEYGTNTTTPAVTGGSYGATGEYGTTAPGEQPYEKKGIMEKIKDKLPGAHN